MRADGVLFDKDGTLFDFSSTWDVWAGGMIEHFSGGELSVSQAIADAIRYDLGARVFLPESPVIAGTNRQAAEAVASALPGRNVDEIEIFLMRSSAEASLAEAVPLAPFLTSLAALGLSLGVMTNDTEFGARSHLRSAGVEDHFDFIAGFDSGYGAKPAPGPLLAFAEKMGLAPERVVMVGDSTHDLIAGRAAGMQTLAVLTGLAEVDELRPFADAILPNIGHVPDWLRS